MGPKVFGIGLPKTGTVSLTRALTDFGLRAIHNPFSFYKQILEEADFVWRPGEWDALVHFGTRYYRHLNRLYPKSRFILTTRDRAAWLDSCERWWSKPDAANDASTHLSNMSTFGTRRFHRAQFGDVFDRHLASVVSWAGLSLGSDKFFVLHLEAENKAQILAQFLDMQLPHVGYTYPHENAQPRGSF